MDEVVLRNGIHTLFRKMLYGIVTIGFIVSALATSPFVLVQARAVGQDQTEPGMSMEITGNVLSNGEFVNGPNVGDFNIQTYLEKNAPQLAKYASDLYGRADYFSINPRVYLTLLEVHAHLISDPDPSKIEDPFGLNSNGFISQIDEISNAMVSAYYLHLYSYTSSLGVFRDLPPISTTSGDPIIVTPETNAGTYALVAAFALIEKEQDIPTILDNNQPDGFFQTYQRLFQNSDPTNDQNHIYYPEEANASSVPVDLLHLQLPYLKGESWMFNGVHDAAGANVGDPLVNAAAIDFSPNWPPWGVDTSNMWVVAAASGIPTRISSCSVRIAHGDGLETGYYHLDSIPNFTGWIDQNERIGVIANNLPQAICTGGFSTGPHVHFTLRRNGAYVAIDGTPLSGWYIHSGRWNYDDDPNYMWMERFGVKKGAGEPLLSESPALISQITAGAAHTCALTSSGAPKCWGFNASGQLGDASTTDRLSPVNVAGLSSGIGAIAAGWNHTCALTSGGALNCWGNNTSGQLGDGTTTDRTSPVNVTGFSSSGAIAVSGGYLHTCLLTRAGGVKCWGDNSLGQLGNGTTTNSLVPVNTVGMRSGIKKISSGNSHTCALTSSNSVKCWGDNARGQLGDGTTTNNLAAVNVSGLSSGVLAISAGFDHTCALTSAGAVKCWGANTFGQLGDGTTDDRLKPVAVTGLSSGLVAISAGNGFTCALHYTGAVKCWGSNVTGQLGDGTNNNQLDPVDVVDLLSGVVSISTGGGEHTCSLTSSGIAQCWGGNAYGQLGDGTTNSQASPVNVIGLTYSLEVLKAGSGTGKVTGSPAGITCGSYCSATYLSGTSISLTSTASTGSTFSGWNGEGCSGSGTCVVNMTAPRSVTANFTLNTYKLSASKTGSGKITSSPTGINCGTDCSEDYNYGTRVTLTATPASGWFFSSWGGRCLGVITTTCTITLDSAKSVSVKFSNTTYALSITKAGNGSGTVTSLPAGINCGSICSYNFADNSLVALTASASSSSTFSGWNGGGCTGTGTCTVTMTAAATVTATFTLNTFTLSVSKTGSGKITSSPAGINCGSDCTEVFNYGTRVTVTATADNGAAFTSWGGRCLGVTTNVCTVVMDDNKSISASFSSNAFTLTLAKTGTGSGTVTSSPAGINCGSTCSYAFTNNTVVTLTASAATGSTFTGWSGSGCSGTGTCVVTINASKSVSAAFTLNTYLLSISKTGTGSGTVTSSPAGINCGSTCSYAFTNNTVVTLTASAATGSTFTGWSGSGCSGIGTCVTELTSARSINADFMIPPAAFNKSLPSNLSTNLPTTVTLSWGSSTGATSYWFCYDTTNDNACSTWVNNGATTNKVLRALAQNTTYYWQVRAKNTAGTVYSNGSVTAFWNFTTGILPGDFLKTAPANGAINQPVSLTLKWSASAAAAYYESCYDTSSDNTCTTWVNIGTSTSKTLSGLSPNTTYYWHVRAVNVIGTTYSNASSTAFWSFTTASTGTLPGAFNKISPANLAVGLPTFVTLSWGVSAGATSYWYCYDTTNDNACNNWIGIGVSTSAMLSDLSLNTTYYWHVRAINASGTTYSNGSSTAFWNFKTAR